MSAHNIDLWVSAGSFEAPYYRFYTDAEGSQELQNLVLDTSKSYTFRRLNEATSHPFYISDTGFKQGSSDALLITGYGSPSQGITGNQSFTIEFTDSAADTEELLYYCSSHSSMQGNIGLAQQYPIIRGNSLYTIVDGPSWTEAEANSLRIGGRLASINNVEENDWLVSTYKDANESPYPGTTGDVDIYWLGLILLNNSWSWSNGEPVEFTNWGYKAPFGNGDRGLFIVEADKNLTEPLWSDTAGKWNDMYDDLRYGGGWNGIAEVPFIRRGDSAYVIVEGPTWEEAEANANALGGHLVTINDAEENKWIAENFSVSKYYYDGDSGNVIHTHFWLGGTDRAEEGSWKWSSGQPWTYDGFDRNHAVMPIPNNEGDSEHDYLVGIFNVTSGDGPIHGDGFGTYYWDDFQNQFGNTSFKGLAEITLAPNNTPTGSPTLTGDFKVGQTISIDASAIDDADNFEGWTPNYEYSWEVSGDNGTTWTELTSADATDGDNSYTLTSEVVGNQLRGVVSYLDGYGTFESIFSAIEEIPSKTNNAPTAITVSSSNIDENIHDGSVVATLSSSDSDSSDSHTYELVEGDGDADNSAFVVQGDQLKIVGSPDFETKSSYSIRLQTTDSSGLTYAAPFEFSVNDLPEPIDKLELLEATIDGDVLTLEFNKPLDSESTPSLDFWTVKEDGKKVLITSIEQRASVAKILLTLDQPVDSQSVITLSYRDLVGDQLSDVVQDSDGFDLSAINDYAVDNQTERSQTELGVLFAEVDGNKVLVAFNRELDDTSPSLAPFRFKANGRKVSIDNAVLDPDGRQLTLTLSRFIRFDETATLMYTDAEGDQRDGVVQDIDGNDLSSFDIDVENASPQESKLELVSGEAEDGLITLDFNEQLSGTKLSKKRFKVKVNNKKAKVDSAELFAEDGYIEVNINKNIEFGDDVLISYKDLNGDQADGVIQDGYGSDLASFKNFSPDVTSPDEQGPILEEVYIDDGQLYLEFDEIIAPGKVKGSRIKLRADGKRLKVKGTTIEDEDTVAVFQLKKQLSPITQELLLSYKDPKRDQRSGVIQDLIGNDMESLQNIDVEIVTL